jgi:hypothetical protein
MNVEPIGSCVSPLEHESLALDGPHCQCQKKSFNAYRIGRSQGAPMTPTFGNRHAREIEDNLTDLDDYSDDGSYQPSKSSDEDDDVIPDNDF